MIRRNYELRGYVKLIEILIFGEKCTNVTRKITHSIARDNYSPHNDFVQYICNKLSEYNSYTLNMCKKISNFYLGINV